MEPDKDRLVVTGEQVDSVKLTRLLRKRIGDTELVSVGVIEDQKPKIPANKPAAVAVKPNEILAPFWYPCPPPHYEYVFTGQPVKPMQQTRRYSHNSRLVHPSHTNPVMAEPTSALPTQPTPIPIFKGDG
ncbi:hypothetical protein E3N88_34557 [Mikania micrantha]|uniref:HMA domain-containing protein n=1 Tax=Mikania micrantha TaxID=192012 RepID=A0A5N6LYG8_9ASTR|nr:hypothetical protein E3N88_34557 [Mikania micrantha]